MFTNRLLLLLLLNTLTACATSAEVNRPTRMPTIAPTSAPVSTASPASIYSASEDSWQLYAFRDGAFHSLISSHWIPDPTAAPQIFDQSIVPPTWHVSVSVLADVTGDGKAEWVLVVWRPWRDWPIQRWSSAQSPIAAFHDEAGDSCHLILLDPRDGHEIWAGSALPAPSLALAVGDVDGDRRSEVVMLEGDYATGRQGSATHVDVWRWNGFGFTLEWRSPAGTFHQLQVVDVDGDRVLDIAVR